MSRRRVLAVRGGGEMASAAARLLFLLGHRVVVFEREQPLAVRRLVCFSQAVSAGACAVEGVPARRLDARDLTASRERDDGVVVVVDEEAISLACLRPDVIVDARMRKTPASPVAAASVIGLGPGFTAGVDAALVVETQRGPSLGRVIRSGCADPDSGEPAPVAGHTHARVLRAPQAGVFRAGSEIGRLVEAGDLLGWVGEGEVRCAIAGLVRGLLAEGTPVEAGIKVGDIDPRGGAVDPARVSDKARAVAAGVIEAVALLSSNREVGGAAPSGLS